ncbi:MAG TPA: CbiX/SirB N-terminal domain-containing protein [Burkholderiaceae bacterium]|nr:CbiX/SirB N-terminal domain-containing protein [Burkholderiaceae bacterium]
MSRTDAIILFAHGARDARWVQPLQRLQEALAQARPSTSVQLAFLELQSPNLEQALTQLAAAGCRRIDIAPIFWAQGGHVAQDLPDVVRQFTARQPEVHVRVLPVLSELPGMDGFLVGAILAQLEQQA